MYIKGKVTSGLDEVVSQNSKNKKPKIESEIEETNKKMLEIEYANKVLELEMKKKNFELEYANAKFQLIQKCNEAIKTYGHVDDHDILFMKTQMKNISNCFQQDSTTWENHSFY